MEDYYWHECDKMNKGEYVRDYGYGYYFEQLENHNTIQTIEDIQFCPKCGVNLHEEWKQKYPDYPGNEDTKKQMKVDLDKTSRQMIFDRIQKLEDNVTQLQGIVEGQDNRIRNLETARKW